MTPGPVKLGCSGWDYAEWVGRFYPRRGGEDRLRHYAGVFPVVEVNSSFYHLPTVRTVESWARRTPAGFRFTAKVPQEITHDRRLQDVEEPLRALRSAFQPLVHAGKLSAFLVQLPPSLSFHEEEVRAFYRRMAGDVPVAVEFREESWLSEASFALLEEFRFAQVVVDEPKLPVVLRNTAPFAYVRWHGHGSPLWYDYTYRGEELSAWVPRVRELQERSSLVLGFFNNHFRADAPMNALELSERLGLSPPPWTGRLLPPDLPGPGSGRGGPGKGASGPTGVAAGTRPG
ncbi:protein containing DUF72 [mine drainage metagenome]|uniref:Protein containing DUF72 n=1 Tax=mine drainage metagenome TaxID=410659 RepID=T1BV65_9ZZZZ